MAIRKFPLEQLELCTDWFDIVEISDVWTDDGPIGEGESVSIRVKNTAGLIGVAKPGKPKTDSICRAAHEKIAFDLAHSLELPIPPVVLWDRGATHQDNRYLSISAWAFPQCEKWNIAEQKGIITDILRISASSAISAMRVFHSWISDTDRKPDHIQVNLDSPNDQLGIAFIDHAFSMSYVWKGENFAIAGCPKYMPTPEVPDVMIQTANHIAALPGAEVERIVNRIPASYLPDLQRQHIINNLLSRKVNLLAILGIQ